MTDTDLKNLEEKVKKAREIKNQHEVLRGLTRLYGRNNDMFVNITDGKGKEYSIKVKREIGELIKRNLESWVEELVKEYEEL